MKEKNFFWRFAMLISPFKKSLSLVLIFVLVFSQTVRFDFFGTAEASADEYRDIISLVVDGETERRLRGEIRRYAEDIQNRLWSTRVVISVLKNDTTPAMIAAQNEKLYYEGEDGDGAKTQLVGTILIGNVPIPMVGADGKYFPSVFPYVDFEHKAFVYNEKSDRYEKVSALNGGVEAVEIWHGVINPAVGRNWEWEKDISLIKDFLDKTHNFYEQTGRFAPQNEPPRVFYFDGFSESKSIELRRVFQYALWIENIENIAYNRFTKHLLTDINNALKEYDKANSSDYADLVAKLGIEGLTAENFSSNTLSDDIIKTTPDVHTKPVTEKLLQTFSEIFNTKVLGEELAAVHNAGRYNSGATVRADLASVQISVVDSVATDTLKKANSALEESFTDFLKENSVARKIPILDSMTAHFGEENGNRRTLGIGHTKGYKNIPYANYFFGTEGKNITSAAQCSIARGVAGEDENYGRSVLVESNVAFDVNSTKGHTDILGQDAANCYSGSNPVVPQLGTFWGGNSLLRVATYSDFENNPLTEFPEKKFTGFVKNIFSTGGMLESDRLPAPLLAQCMDYAHQYTVKEPHRWQEAVPSFRRDEDWVYVDRFYPSNTNGTAFRCNSPVEIISADRVVGNPIESRGSNFSILGNRETNTIPLRADANFLVEAARYSTNTSCLVGTLTVDGHKIENNNSCIYTYKEGGSDGETYTVNNTNYRNLNYHTIDGILYHISPTDEEFKAAEDNGATPNIPVNINRSVEFLTKKGNIAKIQYPNFYKMSAKTVDDVRAWLAEDSRRQWNVILETENSTTQSDFDANISENILGAKNLPTEFDWNDYISDELIVQILQAKNWLHPDVSKKYQDAVESMLSYSGNARNDDILQKMPTISEKSEKTYDIAYLGLAPILPNDGDSSENVNAIKNDYITKLAAIHGYNISENNSQNTASANVSSSTQCGPPEGVDLFKWPSAIQCWIKTQIPVKIHAGQCGGDTIGHDNSSSKPRENISSLGNIEEQKEKLKTAKVVGHFTRKHTSHHSSIDFSTSLQNDTARLQSADGSYARLEVVSVTSGGQSIKSENYKDFFEYNSSDISLASEPKFIITTKDKNFSLAFKVVYSMRLLDGSITTISSEDFVVTASSEFLDANISSEKNNFVTVVTADASEKFFLNISRKKNLTNEGVSEKNFSIKIFDDLNGREIGEITGSNGVVEIPENISKNIGVYRAIIEGDDGVTGEMTFSVVAGQIASAKIKPVSTMIVKNSTTIVTLALEDRMGNSVTPDLYNIELMAENGSLIDASGNAVKKISLDIFDSSVSFMVRGDNVGTMKIFAKVKNNFAGNDVTLSDEKEITVIDSAQVSLQFENPGNTLKIGTKELPVRLRIVDKDGNLLSGFSSVVNMGLPAGAGNFSLELAEIRNGQTEKFTYYPGTVAGVHNLTLNIPGIGIISDVPLTLVAGDGMYIDHSENNNNIIFSVRDRYGNLADYTGKAILSLNANDISEVDFVNGRYIAPKRSGYYVVEIPELEKNKIIYEESGQTHEIPAITKYAVQIFTETVDYDFRSDFNARYTVLAGGSFLREGEDILYHTDKNNSQSLAVSTLLSSPLADEKIFSIFPNGGYSLGRLDDMVLEKNIFLERNFPVMHVIDSVRKNEIAKILYSFQNANLLICEANHECNPEKNSNTIAVKKNLDENIWYNAQVSGGKVIFTHNGVNLATIATDGSIEAQPSISLRLSDYDTTRGFVFEMLHNNASIAEVSYIYSSRDNVELLENIFDNVSEINAPKVQAHTYQIERFSDKILGNSSLGFSLKKNLGYNIFDNSKIWPAGIDDIGTLSENPGVGWMGDNRMLLSYSAGDTVGEATKWFHTYMMVNMGDPVASVEKNAIGTQIDGLDRSIGVRIADGRKSQIHDFFQKDMNADGLSDVLVQYSDGYMELILNIHGKFRSAGYIAYLPRLQNSLVRVGDFTWDKFSDIISLDTDGVLRMISNENRKFHEKEIILTNLTSAPQHIQQIKIYDMDADDRDDIVYLTSGGQLGILYGTEKSGTFEQKILDDTLGITLRDDTDNHGGAIKSNFVTQFTEIIGEDTSDVVNTGTGLTDARIKAEVYYQERADKNISQSQTPIDPAVLANLNANFSDADIEILESTSQNNSLRTTPVPMNTYIRSQYASLVGMEMIKKYSTPNKVLFPKDTISVEISLKNNNGETATGVKYLDTISEIFDRDNTATYSVEIDGKIFEKNFVEKNTGDYDLEFDVGDIPAGATAKITYTLLVLPASYGEMLVGDFEKWLVGHDGWGDIAFHTSTTCGAEMMTWYSREAREYDSSRRAATYDVPLPDAIKDKITDADNNGIPDSVEKMTPEQGMSEYKKMTGNESEKRDLITVNKEWKRHVRIGFDEKTSKNIESKAQEIADGLSCGFGGGSCMSFPINWAPLAPGNDPVVFGSPVGDGFKVNEGIPVFSALTAINVPTSHGCYQVPTVWPGSPLRFQGSCTGTRAAGGYLGSASTNFVRVFVTPTLTMGMGSAVCLGGPANRIGANPGKWLSPLVQGGNCIVMVKPMPVCQWDGSIEDGDISGISGLGVPGSGTHKTREVWNGESCSLTATPVATLRDEEKKLESEILDYMLSPSEKTANIVGITAKISKRNVSSLSGGPLLNIGSGGDPIEVSITGADKISDIGKVVKPNNKRISAFPDFIMDWLTRQTEELTTSLFTPPNLTIIPPTDFGQNAKVDSSYSDFLDKLSQAYSAESFNNMRAEMSSAYQNTNVSTNNLTGGANSWLGNNYENMLGSATSSIAPAINGTQGGLNSMRAAYAFIGKLPFLNIRETRIDINVPWILPSELDQYERQLKNYQNQAESALANWCATGESTECLQAKTKLNSSGFYSSIQANLKRIEEYRQFPEKLQKYVTWKQKLLYDLLCNIEAVEKMTFGWIKDNGVRFQKWAELYVLIKAIAQSWQPLLDIFAETNAQCGVCRNERHNSQKWKFKLISAIIPKIPVISFPKWPDIVLDLSDVRLGVDISVPDFNFRISPMRLPSLPSISFPSSPNANFSLPTLPVLPALPSLPDLPEIPSLPTVDLPDLPPPPKLPKLSGSIAASLDILKLISKLYCYYQKTVLIPEWQVGDVIAQRTERQSSLPMDFIDIQFPQFSVPTIKEIRISTHLNYTLRTDFITEFAKNAVKPINEFTTDLSNKIPSRIDTLDNAANSIQQGLNNASQSVHDAVDSVEDSANNVRDNIQNSSDNINNQSRNIENNLQNTSDNIEESAQDAVDNSVSYENFSENLSVENIENILDPIIAKMEAEKDIFYDTEEFYNYFKKELIASGFVREAADLDMKMIAARTEAKKIEKELTDFNTEKFSLLKKFIKEQERKTGEMQNIVDLLRSNDAEKLASSPYVVGHFASENIANNSLALAQLANLEANFDKKIFDTNSTIDTISAQDIGASLQSRVKRIAQLTTTESADVPEHQISLNIPNEYLPKFEGMYVLTEVTNTQTKLFDYTELVSKNDRVDVLDIDNDGDKDYIFVLGGKLYVKNTHLQEPQKKIDTSVSVEEISQKNPEVANNFVQVLSTPSELNVSFQNTVSDEKEWRMEFYDRYLEWDRMDIKSSEYNSTPRTTVDLFLNENFGNFENGMRSVSIARSIRSGEDSPNFILQWPKIEKISGNIFVSISPNRTIYTGNRDVRIKYRSSADSIEKFDTLRAYTAYQFDSTTEIIAESGDIFVIGGGTGNYRYSATDRLSGLPVLPGMRITSTEKFEIFDHTHRQNISLPANSEYIVKSLGTESERYNFTIPYTNGHYYARLQHLSQGKNNKTSVTLVSPQYGSDSTNPVISLSESIRVPVYATEKFAFSDFITELSQYSVEIDEDTSVDANNNGIFDDDFTESRSHITLSEQEMTVWPFDVPGQREMLLKVRDEFWNTSYMPISVEVFTPIPNLQNISENRYLSGILDTTTDGEPIDFFRIRNSEYPFMFNSGSVLTENGGKFSSGSFTTPEQIFVKSNTEQFEIKKSGIFSNLPAGYELRVVSANAIVPMSMQIFDVQKKLVYEQFLSLPSSARIVADNATDKTGNLVITPTGNYQFISAAFNDPKLPGGAYIVNSTFDAILAVARDGNIYALDQNISLSISEKDDFILITAHRGSEKIAEFHYMMNFFYTTK